jgi:predicted TIM-barrel fold metal-dependent hydrolase
MRIVDTHEHLFDPDKVKITNFFDFMLLVHQQSYEDLISSGMPDSLFNTLFNKPLAPIDKWKIIEPYWRKSFNTSFNRIVLLTIKNLYKITDLNESTVGPLSEKIKKTNNTDWFNRILRDSCRIDYVIQEDDYIPGKDDFFRYTKKFSPWLSVRSKYRIDSLAVMQVDPIYTLEDFVKSMRVALAAAVKNGLVAIKINLAYKRTLSFDRVETETARKVFRSLVNGNEDHVISYRDAKPLQDYMFYKLMDLVSEYKLPVAFHTGLQAGGANIIGNSNPALLANVFREYPDINFTLYHGSYPFGGELSTLAKNFKNVSIDMNWTFGISPAYSERYLNEWLETVPAGKIMAFGGDCRTVEIIYGELIIAKQIISNVLISKVRDGYLSESEAKTIAKMILHDNAVTFYNLH